MSPLIGSRPFERQWQEIEADVLAATAAVGARGWYIQGDRLRSIEAKLARALGRGAGIGCGNGLDALQISLMALGLEPGELVLTTPMSAFATTLAILRLGARPLFVDVDASGSLDLALARECLEKTPGVRFAVPVHLYGHCLDLHALTRLRDDFGLTVIEDGAQALGAGWAELRVGDVGRTLATSFYPTKNLGALGDGGALFTDEPELAEAARCLRDYGQAGKYVHTRLGLNSRLDELQAAILESAMMPRWPAWEERRRQIASLYLAGLAHPRVAPLPVSPLSRSVWHLFPVLVAGELRQHLLDHLRGCGVLGLVHYPVAIPDQPVLAENPRLMEIYGDLPRARALAAGEVSLPITPDLSDQEIHQVIEAVNTWSP